MCVCSSVDLEYYFNGQHVTIRKKKLKRRSCWRSLRGFGEGNSIRIYTVGQMRVETNNNIVLRTIVAADAARGLATSQKSRRSRPLSEDGLSSSLYIVKIIVIILWHKYHYNIGGRPETRLMYRNETNRGVLYKLLICAISLEKPLRYSSAKSAIRCRRFWRAEKKYRVWAVWWLRATVGWMSDEAIFKQFDLKRNIFFTKERVRLVPSNQRASMSMKKMVFRRRLIHIYTCYNKF